MSAACCSLFLRVTLHMAVIRPQLSSSHPGLPAELWRSWTLYMKAHLQFILNLASQCGRVSRRPHQNKWIEPRSLSWCLECVAPLLSCLNCIHFVLRNTCGGERWQKIFACSPPLLQLQTWLSPFCDELPVKRLCICVFPGIETFRTNTVMFAFVRKCACTHTLTK